MTELQSLSDEYVSWREALPDNLSESELAYQLDDTVDQLAEVVDLLSQVELPYQANSFRRG